MPRIQVIQESEATGELKDIYDHLVQSRGKLAEVHKIQSLNPKTIMSHMELYMDIMYAKSPLSRAQRELMAVVVSKENKCPYCMKHHAEALARFWRDDEKLEQLMAGQYRETLDEKEYLLATLAQELTLHPSSEQTENIMEALKVKGLDDRAILDATLVIAYFNFVNRMVLGLGVELEEDEGKGYNYE
jgi:uncharacterized peroxidase-related enzyme